VLVALWLGFVAPPTGHLGAILLLGSCDPLMDQYWALGWVFGAPLICHWEASCYWVLVALWWASAGPWVGSLSPLPLAIEGSLVGGCLWPSGWILALWWVSIGPWVGSLVPLLLVIEGLLMLGACGPLVGQCLVFSWVIGMITAVAEFVECFRCSGIRN
jgi:hypothetical protein